MENNNIFNLLYSIEMTFIWRFGSLVTLFFLLLFLSLALLLKVDTISLIYTNYPSFPHDSFGMHDSDRLRLAHETMEVFLGSAKRSVIFRDVLGEITFVDGKRAYTGDEIAHLFDVYVLTLAVRVLGWGGFIFQVLLLIRIGWKRYVEQFLVQVKILFVLATITIVSLLLFWRQVFIGFHQVLFPQGNWTFSVHSTLIRLFPEKFWIAFGILFVLLLAFFSGILWIAALLVRRYQTRESSVTAFLN